MAQGRVKKNFEGRRIKCQHMRHRPSAYPTYTLTLAPLQGLGVVDTARNRQRPSHNAQSPARDGPRGMGRRVCAEEIKVEMGLCLACAASQAHRL